MSQTKIAKDGRDWRKNIRVEYTLMGNYCRRFTRCIECGTRIYLTKRSRGNPMRKWCTECCPAQEIQRRKSREVRRS